MNNKEREVYLEILRLYVEFETEKIVNDLFVQAEMFWATYAQTVGLAFWCFKWHANYFKFKIKYIRGMYNKPHLSRIKFAEAWKGKEHWRYLDKRYFWEYKLGYAPDSLPENYDYILWAHRQVQDFRWNRDLTKELTRLQNTKRIMLMK